MTLDLSDALDFLARQRTAWMAWRGRVAWHGRGCTCGTRDVLVIVGPWTLARGVS